MKLTEHAEGWINKFKYQQDFCCVIVFDLICFFVSVFFKKKTFNDVV